MTTRVLLSATIALALTWAAPAELRAQSASDSTRAPVATAPEVALPASCAEMLRAAESRRRTTIRRAMWLGAAAGTAVLVVGIANADENFLGPLALLATPVFAIPGAAAGWLVASLVTPVPEAGTHCQPEARAAPSP